MHRLEEYITVGTRRLRCGYTTGTCAAAAARAAAELLVHASVVPAVVVQTPSGLDVLVEVEQHETGAGWAQCAVRKDAGDDHDVTDGALVVVRVEWSAEPGIRIAGGVGVGRVTRAGLDQPVGEAAINSVPRRMIREQVEAVLAAEHSEGRLGDVMLKQSCFGESATGAFASCGTARGTPQPPFGAADAALEGNGVLVTVSVPDGEALAERTFNPRLGIVGGISIIGTSGIVRPMSEDALVASIELELRTIAAAGARDLLVVPGNYGRDFARKRLGLRGDEAVQCSNYFGATLDAACVLGFERVLIVGHLGKMVKVAAGVMNTHSRVADCRVEALAAHAALVGAPMATIGQIMESATTDAALDALYACGLAEATMESLMTALADKLRKRVAGRMQVEAIVFSNVHGVLGRTPGAAELSRRWLEEEEG